MAPTKKLIQTVELTEPLVPQEAKHLLVTGDNNANTIILHVEENGKPADLTGCNAVAYMIRSDGKRPFADGKVKGNTVTVCLNEAFYAMAERYHLFVRLNHTDGTKTTLLWLNGWANSEGTGDLIDTGNAVPNLDDLLAQIAAMEEATAKAQAAASIAESKLDKALGTEYAGKLLYVDGNGSIVTLALGAGLAIENGILRVIGGGNGGGGSGDNGGSDSGGSGGDSGDSGGGDSGGEVVANLVVDADGNATLVGATLTVTADGAGTMTGASLTVDTNENGTIK